MNIEFPVCKIHQENDFCYRDCYYLCHIDHNTISRTCEFCCREINLTVNCAYIVSEFSSYRTGDNSDINQGTSRFKSFPDRVCQNCDRSLLFEWDGEVRQEIKCDSFYWVWTFVDEEYDRKRGNLIQLMFDDGNFQLDFDFNNYLMLFNRSVATFPKEICFLVLSYLSLLLQFHPCVDKIEKMHLLPLSKTECHLVVNFKFEKQSSKTAKQRYRNVNRTLVDKLFSHEKMIIYKE